MAGLAELLLGASNPFAQWANTHSNFLGSIGAGLGSGQNFAAGVSNAAQLAPQGRALDQQEAEKAKAEAKVAAQENATKAWLAQNYPQYSDLPVDQGFQLALKEMSGGATDLSETTSGRQLLADQYGLSGNDRLNYVLTGKLPASQEFAPPSGYRTTPEGNLAFIPGGPADPSVKASTISKPLTEAEKRANALNTATANDAKLLLGDGTSRNPGLFNSMADLGNQVADSRWALGPLDLGQPFRALSSPEYQQATNALTNIAQSYLYSVSGQAAPASEVAKIVDSVTPKMGEAPASVEAKRKRLEAYIEAIRQQQRQPSGEQTGTQENPATPSSQTEYDALPSGAVYVDPDDGQLYRKP